jgi:ribosomal protein S4
MNPSAANGTNTDLGFLLIPQLPAGAIAGGGRGSSGTTISTLYYDVILTLNKENWLKRRLQTIVYLKKIALTPKQARQLITHKHIVVENRVINIPSYMVSLNQENQININITLKIQNKKISEIEKIKNEIIEGEAE